MGTLENHGGGADRLSGLPDLILTHILSFLPTKDAVRASILSTRWRCLYTSVTSFDFDYGDHCSDDFMNFVERVLFLHDTPFIERFRLRCGERDSDGCAYRICTWISFALRRRVQELHLDISIEDPSSFILPSSLFTSKTLVKLVLNVSGLLVTVPTKVCLPSLKTLQIEPVNFIDGDSIQRLFSGFLVLEELVLYYYPGFDASHINVSIASLKRLTIEYVDEDGGHVQSPNIVIDAPSLVYLDLYDILAESYLLLNLRSLVIARLEYLFFREDFNPEIAPSLLKGICCVQSLFVTPDFLRLFTLCNKRLPMFCNLVQLEISDSLNWFFGEKFSKENELTKFLASSPNLETLIFHTGALKGVAFNPSKRVPCCLLFRLNVIEINSFDGQMEGVEYFLKNARVLAKLKIQMGVEVNEQFEIAKKLLMLPKESKNCQVEIV